MVMLMSVGLILMYPSASIFPLMTEANEQTLIHLLPLNTITACECKAKHIAQYYLLQNCICKDQRGKKKIPISIAGVPRV